MFTSDPAGSPRARRQRGALASEPGVEYQFQRLVWCAALDAKKCITRAGSDRSGCGDGIARRPWALLYRRELHVGLLRALVVFCIKECVTRSTQCATIWI